MPAVDWDTCRAGGTASAFPIVHVALSSTPWGLLQDETASPPGQLPPTGPVVLAREQNPVPASTSPPPASPPAPQALPSPVVAVVLRPVAVLPPPLAVVSSSPALAGVAAGAGAVAAAGAAAVPPALAFEDTRVRRRRR